MVPRNCLAEHYYVEKEEKAVKAPPGLPQAADAAEDVWTPFLTKLGEYGTSGFSSKEGCRFRQLYISPHDLSASHHSLGNHLANPLNHPTPPHSQRTPCTLLLHRAFLPKLHSMDWANRCSLSWLAICPVCPPPHTSLQQHANANSLFSAPPHWRKKWILSRFAAVMIRTALSELLSITCSCNSLLLRPT
jgi:hypothetical protein